MPTPTSAQGGVVIPLLALNKLGYKGLASRAVGLEEGVVFSTYTSLIAQALPPPCAAL